MRKFKSEAIGNSWCSETVQDVCVLAGPGGSCMRVRVAKIIQLTMAHFTVPCLTQWQLADKEQTLFV